MSYGSAAGVAALSPMWTDSGSFTASTNPTLTQVNTWIGEVSKMLDSVLADEGFTTPVTDTDVTPMLDLLVNGFVTDLVNYSRKSGRFYSKKQLDEGASPFMTIDKEVHEWVARKAIGLQALGVEVNEDIRGRHVASIDLL